MSLFNNSILNKLSYQKCKNRNGIIKYSNKASDLLSNTTFCNTNISPEHICLSPDNKKCCKDSNQDDCLDISKCNSKYDAKINNYLSKQDFTVHNTVCHTTIIPIWNILTNSLLKDDKADLSNSRIDYIRLSQLKNVSMTLPLDQLNKFMDNV